MLPGSSALQQGYDFMNTILQSAKEKSIILEVGHSYPLPSPGW